MFLSVRDEQLRIEARKYRVIDKDTGKEIPFVVWANDETGRYRQYLTDESGKILLNKNKDGLLTKIFKGNIKLVKI